MRKTFLKRIAVIGLAGVMLFAAGCTPSQETAGGEVPTLSWLVPGDSQLDMAAVMEEANKIIEPAIGAKLDLQLIDAGSFSEKMTMHMAAQYAYDLCFTGYVNKYRNAVDNGSLEPLTPLIDEYAPELWDLIPEYCWQDSRVDGEVYAVPNVQVEFYQYCIWIQKDLAEQYGFDYESVTTPNEIEPFLKTIKENEPDLYPFKPNGILLWWKPFYEEVFTRTMMVVDADGTSDEVLLLRDTDEFKLGVATLRDWYLKGYIRKDISSMSSDSGEANQNKYAAIAGQWKPGQETDLFNQRKKEYYPIMIGEPYMINGNVNQTMVGIGNNSKNKEKAVQLIALMNSNKELYNLISYGIEGKHYDLSDEGKVVKIPKSGYNPSAAWKFGNQFNALLTDGQQDDVWEVTERMNDEAKKSPLLGFGLDTNPITNETAQMTAILDEYESMNQGSRDYEEFKDTMASRLKSAGEDKVLAEIQKQVSEFMAER